MQTFLTERRLARLIQDRLTPCHRGQGERKYPTENRRKTCRALLSGRKAALRSAMPKDRNIGSGKEEDENDNLQNDPPQPAAPIYGRSTEEGAGPNVAGAGALSSAPVTRNTAAGIAALSTFLTAVLRGAESGRSTSPTKRSPLRGSVRIRRCVSPLSPTAVRAALMHVVKADSETMRPFHTSASNSSLLITRSRLRMRYSMTSNAWGSTAMGRSPRRSSRFEGSSK